VAEDHLEMIQLSKCIRVFLKDSCVSTCPEKLEMDLIFHMNLKHNVL